MDVAVTAEESVVISMKRMAAVACIMFIAPTARASLCSATQTALAGFNGTQTIESSPPYSVDVGMFHKEPEDKFPNAAFDFGLEFSRIDSVSLEIVAPAGWGNGSDRCWVALAVYDPPAPVELSRLSNRGPNLLQAVLLHAEPGIPTTVYFSKPLGELVANENEAIAAVSWPKFLFSGRGVIGVVGHGFSNYSRTSNGSVVLPTTEFSSIRLQLNGIEVPEPHACYCLAFIAGLVSAERRQRTVITA